jgi:hypothetical protein
MRRQKAQSEHLGKSKNVAKLQASMRRQKAQSEHLGKSKNAAKLQAYMRQQLAQGIAKKSSTSSSSSNHTMRFLDGKRKGNVVYIRKKKN